MTEFIDPDDELFFHAAQTRRRRAQAPKVLAPQLTQFGNSVLLNQDTDWHRLLDTRLDKVDPTEIYKAGSWVLSLQIAQEVNPSVNAVVDARVTFGSGGSTVNLTLTPMTGSTLQIPASAITVDVRRRDNVTVSRVNGFIQRGFSQSIAEFQQTLTWANVALSGSIPNFAKRVRIDVIGTSPPLLSQGFIYTFGGTVLRGLQVKKLMQTGDWIEIGSSIFQWQIRRDSNDQAVGPTAGEINLQWGIQL